MEEKERGEGRRGQRETKGVKDGVKERGRGGGENLGERGVGGGEEVEREDRRR